MLNFPGALYPVNPKSPMILGKTAYPSLSAIPDTVDAVVIAIPAPAVPGDRRGGREKEDSARDHCLVRVPGDRASRKSPRRGGARHGPQIRVPDHGPQLPRVHAPARQGINTTFDPVSPRPGSIAFISQSGAIITTIVDWSLPEEIGFSAVISVGNQADLTFEDFIRWTAADPATNAIILYVEEITERQALHGDRQPDHPDKTRDRDKIRLVKNRAEGSLVAHGFPSRERYESTRPRSGRPDDPGPVNPGSIPGRRTPGVRRVPQRHPGRRNHKSRRVCGALLGLCRAVRDRTRGVPGGAHPKTGRGAPRKLEQGNPIDMVGDSHPDRFAKTFDVMIRHQDLWDIAFVIAVPTAISDPIRVANETGPVLQAHPQDDRGLHDRRRFHEDPAADPAGGHIPNFPDLEDAFRAAGNICQSTSRKNTDVPAGAERAPWHAIREGQEKTGVAKLCHHTIIYTNR